ncbi:Kae1-associated serine/threonine protein kinase [Candidatus Pacearchaeota archaeon]|nr:Kae1-associated serine/threonine protein kinase [Candidatus Pacearchaeota archaeon]
MVSKLIAQGAGKSKICAPSKSKLIAQGAEAKILLSDKTITKDRIVKSYRIPKLDNKIRKSRTKAETKLLNKASKIINIPTPIIEDKDKFQIKMPFIDGKKLSDNLNKFPLLKQKQICKQIGQDVAKIHDENIIHGDLTTSNMILKDNLIFFIDFGLGYISHKFEDKAVDIHLFKQALEAKHFQNWEILFKEFEKSYSKSKDAKIIFERLKAVEKRGRYKH